MALLDVVFRLLNKSGDGFVEARREDGHGSSADAPSHVRVSNLPAVQQVSGTVALDTASLVALENVTVNVEAGASVGVNNFPATQAVSDGGGSLTVDGTVSVSNFPATQAVSATDLDIRNLSSAQDNIRAFDSTDSEYLRIATSVTAAGDTTLVTPSAGKRIRLQWVYAINDPTASVATKLTIKLGTAVQYVAWAISKRQQLTGAVDAPLIINLSAAGDVAVTVFYQEV